MMQRSICSGEQNAFNKTFEFSQEEIDSLESSDLHILDWLQKNNKHDERAIVVRSMVLPAVLSDMLHCIFEALSASKEGKNGSGIYVTP